MYDVKVVNWTISELEKSHHNPFFLACGFTSHICPGMCRRNIAICILCKVSYFPDTLDNDRDDLPAWGKKLAIEVYNVSGA